VALLARRPDDAWRSIGCFRAIHTLKGSAGLFDLPPMGLMLHAAEDLLGALRAGADRRSRISRPWLSVVDQVDRWLDELARDWRAAGRRGVGDVESAASLASPDARSSGRGRAPPHGAPSAFDP
jgi:two-component system chemotaxis sensor kinase CheA